MSKAIVPGTFDPITNGHLDVVARASQLFDEVVVAVAASEKKKPLFTLEERVALAAEATEGFGNVTVEGFDGLLTTFAEEQGAHVIVKGLRAITDFEYEFQMTAMNYQMDSAIETLFVMSPPEYMYLSSSIVRELAALHGVYDQFVPACVKSALEKRFA